MTTKMKLRKYVALGALVNMMGCTSEFTSPLISSVDAGVYTDNGRLGYPVKNRLDHQNQDSTTQETNTGCELLFEEYKIGNYPKPFVVNNKFEGLFVLGEKAESKEMLAVSDISSALVKQGIEVVVGSTVLDSELMNLQNKKNLGKNKIYIGTPCNNYFTGQALKVCGGSCNETFNNEGRIFGYKSGDLTFLFVTGSSADYVRKAAKALAEGSSEFKDCYNARITNDGIGCLVK
ncbi:hypothetical protein HYX11_01190 [Candidatus Woesearchaeota archaeon]|nr:hypothetical protein [Candidatus Woesearchaeota archaeon]